MAEEKDSNWQIFSRLLAKHKGELVIGSINDIVLLVGLCDIPDDDYYWEYMDWQGEISKSTCVGSFIPLKPYLPKEIYADLCNIFYINAIKPRLEIYGEIKESIAKKIGRDPKCPIWGSSKRSKK